jgi:hypothetical protein
MKYKHPITTAEFMDGIREGLPEIATKLADSPQSLTGQIREKIGFYSGLCYARDEEIDFDFLRLMESFLPNS